MIKLKNHKLGLMACEKKNRIRLIGDYTCPNMHKNNTSSRSIISIIPNNKPWFWVFRDSRNYGLNVPRSFGGKEA